MKICHLSSAHGQEDIRIFHKECVSLAKAGYEVYEITKGKTYDKSGVHIIGVESRGTGRLQRMVGVTHRVYRKAIEIDADVYHAHDPELLPVLMKLKRRGKKVIFDSHEHTVGTIEEKTYLPKLFRKIIQSAYESYQTRICCRLDAVITATPNVTAYFQSVGCHRVIDLCNFPIISGKLADPDYSSRTVVFAGGISPQWNHEGIIRAIARLDNVRYLLCGVAESAYIERLCRLPGWEKVDFKGRMPYEQVSEILKSSAVGLSLLTPGANTDGENGNMANNKIFEEMMAGLPVICTNFVRWGQFVNRYDCGLCIDPHDERMIAEAIQRLISNPEEAKRMGHNGRLAVEREFNWSVEEKKLLALYKTIEGEYKKW